MPLIRIELTAGRPDAEVRAISDAVHAAVVQTYGIPDRDRFHVISEHAPGRIVALDAGLGFARDDDALVVLQILTQRGRSDAAKQELYAALAAALEPLGCGGANLFIGYSENGPQDWSFGFGRAQYMSGELKIPAASASTPA